MDERFAELVGTLDGSFKKLTSMEPAKTTALPRGVPASGVYVLYEDGNPLYVGQKQSYAGAPARARAARRASQHCTICV